MRVLITGGTGFIGWRLAHRHLADGDAVRVLGRENNAAEAENARSLREAGTETINGSVTDERVVADAVEGCDVVYHLAAAQHEAGVPDQYFWEINVTGVQTVLDACVQAGVKRVVHGSTIGVYGAARNGLLDESSPAAPENIYGVTKLAGERLAQSYHDRLALAIIRISETYGPGDRRLLKLFRAIRKGRFLMIGKGENVHQPIYVDDLVHALQLAATREEAIGRLFVVAGPREISTREMVGTIEQELGAGQRLPAVPMKPVAVASEVAARFGKALHVQPPLHPRRLDFFRKSFHFNTSAIADTLGFHPEWDFERGVHETAEYYRSASYL